MSSPAFPIIRCGASASCCRGNGVDRAGRGPDRAAYWRRKAPKQISMPLTPGPSSVLHRFASKGWSQRSVPLRVRQEVQEMLRQGRLKSVAGPPRFTPDAYRASAWCSSPTPRWLAVVRELDPLVAGRGCPAMCVSDNGTESHRDGDPAWDANKIIVPSLPGGCREFHAGARTHTIMSRRMSVE